jgi:thymidylate kinase
MRHAISIQSVRPPRGLWVVLLGPDGVGKSSVIEGISSGQLAGFAGCVKYHLRPARSGRDGSSSPNCNPHGRSPRGTLISMGKLVYLLLANWWGYWAAVRPQLAKGKLVLFDRYFPDCLVDGKRYRLPDSCRRFARLISELVPKPDVYVVLDAPADVLRARKSEVSVAESERQRNDYARLVDESPSVAMVDAARPLAEVLDEVMSRIVGLRQVRAGECNEAAC